ncbi:curli assembly protein CsgF [Zobellia alginiliquefaciens]|uniref:curli assembly protein CsgF n=1 Tax=Zobellia alginiliquefaciens TaxID=3032586 RepID=UPI0023E16C48|nr:curli assembly protein CsgF [Zobellia alginiliquefaciens]
MKYSFLILFLTLGLQGVSGQQLSYKPINPMFGGDTFNYQQLMASAAAQNSFKDPGLGNEQTELESFNENLNRQVLSQISKSVLNTQLGDELTEGTFTVGDLAVEIYDSLEGLVINILNTTTGEQSQVIIPN